MKRQFFALGLVTATIGGFALMQPAMAAVPEVEDNTFRAQDVNGQSNSRGEIMQGQVSKSGNLSKNDPVDMFTVTVPPGKQLRVAGVPGAHPNNVIMKLILDDNNNATSDRSDRSLGFVAPGVVRTSLASPIPLKYIVHVSLDDPRGEVPNTGYMFTWMLR